MTLISRVATVTERGRVEMQEIDVPESVDGGIVARVLLTGICGTDVHLVDDAAPLPGVSSPYPLQLGHEMVVEIVSLGKDAPQQDTWGSPLGVGDRIVFAPSSWACGWCYACRVLLSPNNCLHPARTQEFPDILAGFGDYVVIPPQSLLFKVPDGMSTTTAVLTEPMAGASRAITRALRPGNPDRGEGLGLVSSVVIQGAGAIGALLTILARHMGAGHITVIGEPASRRDLCLALGADLGLGLDISAEERRREVLRHTPLGLGADVVLEASGAPSALVEAMDLARIEGTVVEFGAYTLRGASMVDASVLCRKDLTVLGSHGYGPGQFGTALRILERFSASVDFDALVTHTVRLADFADGLELARSGAGVKVGVMP